MPTQAEIRQSITQQIIDGIDAGVRPWVKPWVTTGSGGPPCNAETGKNYSGVNPLILNLHNHRHGHTSRFFGTYRQWQKLRGQVRRRPKNVKSGQWGAKIIFCRPITKEEIVKGVEVEKTFFMLKEYSVFGIDQVDGEHLDFLRYQEPTTSEEPLVTYEQFDDMVTATEADIRHGGNQCFYQLKEDYIQMPHRQQFSGSSYAESLAHELGHWSEADHRLDREEMADKDEYAFSELVAEISACYVCSELGVSLGHGFGNHASYVAHWLKALRNDPSFIFKASNKASRVSDFLLSFQKEPIENEESAVVA